MFRDSAGKYVKYTAAQLQELIKKNGVAVSFGVTGVVVLGAILYAMKRGGQNG
jgi:hypothetical protein